jgi:hypothetical protein
MALSGGFFTKHFDQCVRCQSPMACSQSEKCLRSNQSYGYYAPPPATPADTPEKKLARDVKCLGQTTNPTFRMQVAMHALEGMLASASGEPDDTDPAWLADLAIQRADALIARLAKDEP